MRADELFGSSHQGKCQKRYRHLKDWNIFRGDKCICSVQTDTKDSNEEISQVKHWLKELNGTSAVLRWTATEHFDCEKVEVTI